MLPLETDITKLEQIITELLKNACKLTPVGESITISANLSADTVELKVCYRCRDSQPLINKGFSAILSFYQQCSLEIQRFWTRTGFGETNDGTSKRLN